jgi:CheY-like chemotaxis protein
MRPGDRTRLLFGPYSAPRLRSGDRATCLFKDCDVAVTGWTDARISWPRHLAQGRETLDGARAAVTLNLFGRAVRRPPAPSTEQPESPECVRPRHRPGHAMSSATPPSAFAPSRRVLVVEDNAIAREGLAVVLRRAGYEVVTATNGQEAIDLLGAGPRPDLILLDMLMPVLDGWHFLGLLRGRGPAPPVPVVVTTGTILTREWAAANGCAGFLHKPIDAEALLEEVRRCLA